MDEQTAKDMATEWLRVDEGPGDYDRFERQLWVAVNALVDWIPAPDGWTCVAAPVGSNSLPGDLLILTEKWLFVVTAIEPDPLEMTIRRYDASAVRLAAVTESRTDDRGADRRQRKYTFELPSAEPLEIDTARAMNTGATPRKDEVLGQLLAERSGWTSKTD